jgi:hypothetical protein
MVPNGHCYSHRLHRKKRAETSGSNPSSWPETFFRMSFRPTLRSLIDREKDFYWLLLFHGDLGKLLNAGDMVFTPAGPTIEEECGFLKNPPAWKPTPPTRPQLHWTSQAHLKASIRRCHSYLDENAFFPHAPGDHVHGQHESDGIEQRAIEGPGPGLEKSLRQVLSDLKM